MVQVCQLSQMCNSTLESCPSWRLPCFPASWEHRKTHLPKAFAGRWMRRMGPFPDLTSEHFHATFRVLSLCSLPSWVETIPPRISRLQGRDKQKKLGPWRAYTERLPPPGSALTVSGARNSSLLCKTQMPEQHRNSERTNACHGPCSLGLCPSQEKTILINKKLGLEYQAQPFSARHPVVTLDTPLLRSKVIYDQQLSNSCFLNLKIRIIVR